DHINAAAVPLAGLTAWQGLFDRGHLQKGQKVLIHAASGGVGTFAVQFAKWKGAYVIGTASEANISFVKQLGADEVIDYHKENFEDVLNDIDLVFDTIGGDTQKRSIQVLKNGGRLITTLKPEFQAEAREKHIYLEGYTAQSYPDQLEQIAGLIDQGIIQPVISMVLSLDEIRKAQQISEEGHVRGKIVIKVV
ncbi:MAG: NADP-dependent oxidoreductase, partial [Mucilaginibacter sp.]